MQCFDFKTSNLKTGWF